MASFPDSVKSFTTKNAADVIQAAHVNDLQDEANAIEAGYLNGTARLNSSNSTLATLSVTGNSTLAGSVNAGASTLASLHASGHSTFAGALQVGGNSTLAGSVNAGASTLASLHASGHSTFAGSLNVAGGTTLVGSVNINGSLNVGNPSTLATLSVTGGSTLGSLIVSGGTIVTTFAATGGSTVNTIHVQGNSTFGGSLGIAGTSSMVALVVTTFGQFAEVSTVAAAPADSMRIYCRDNGSGKQQLVVIFPSGAGQIVATEP